ncbi:MAG: hypothetical protein VKJ46_13895 [Leptolyngbyaceae bacterium]|nr:hypothetical protein [Leptolyngbyaceae bacterium]
MLQTPSRAETEALSIELPKKIGLFVTQEQFAALVAANRDLRLERTPHGELIVNLLDGSVMHVSRFPKNNAPPKRWLMLAKRISISVCSFLSQS